MRRINDAIFGDPKRLDRNLWLSRFSDLMLNGIRFAANAPIDLTAWRRAVREGRCDILLQGYSHVFVSGPSDAAECSDFVIVAETDAAYQEVFSRGRLREIVSSYWKDVDPMPIRKAVAGIGVWKDEDYRKPSEPVHIADLLESHNTKLQASDPPNSDAEEVRTPQVLTRSQPPSLPSEPEPHHDPQLASSTSTLSPAWLLSPIGPLLGAYPDMTLDSAEDIEWLKQVENACKGALQHFQLQSKLVSHVLTPNAALLKFQGSANLTVEQVLRRRSEFLTTHKLNVISVRAEPGIVVIAVARPHRRVLLLPEVWKGWNPDCSRGNHVLLIAVKEEDSSLLFLSPKTNAPHTLIAGSTGSGKSVLMQNIILAIACTNTPAQAKIVLIDPKMGVDYFAFEGLPHLHDGIIDDQDRALLSLNDLVAEMNRRYLVLRENRVSSIFDLNAKPTRTETLPFLWVIHDEFAEWMLTEEYAHSVSDIVGRLGVKARAAGISLVFAAQRPDARVMPLQLRANLGNRLVLRVDGEGTSEIALSEKGAERLLGKGHLAARLEGEPEIVFGQVPFVDSDFLAQVVTALKEDMRQNVTFH
jgi:S-DNA-T family DNA segregation ATPase FtsK/SpoIIIE